MKKIPEDINDLIIRCLIGEASKDDMDNLRSWTEASADNLRHFQEVEAIWTSSTTSESLSRFNPSEAFARFAKRVDAAGGFEDAKSDGPVEETVITRSHSWFYMPVWARWAAVILIIAGCFWASFHMGRNGVEKHFADITIEAPVGSQTITTLPDGSKVTLNAGSRVSYSQGFGISDRDVELTGEGYFEVSHNGSLPFTVSTGNIRVNDVGTKFNVRDYPDDDEAEVVLTEGAVSLDNLLHREPAVTMKPGDRAVLSKASGNLIISSGTTTQKSAWTQGLLVLDGKAIQDIARELEHAYGVKVTVGSNRLALCQFFGTFNTHTSSLRDILDALSATGKLRYRITGKGVIIY